VKNPSAEYIFAVKSASRRVRILFKGRKPAQKALSTGVSEGEENKTPRAAIGGHRAAVKCGGQIYAARPWRRKGPRPSTTACDQVVFLEAVERRYVRGNFGGMKSLFVFSDGFRC